MDERRRAGSAAPGYRSFQSALDHLFHETEKHLALEPSSRSARSERARVSGGVNGVSSRREAYVSPSPASYLDSDVASEVDDSESRSPPLSLSDEHASPRVSLTPLSPSTSRSPRHAFGAESARGAGGAASGRHSAAGMRSSSSAASLGVGSRRRAHSSGRHAPSSAASVHGGPAMDPYDPLAGGSAYQRAHAQLHPSGAHYGSGAPSGMGPHELELLQRLERVRSSVEHYRAASEQQARLQESKVRGQLHTLMSRLDVQLGEVEQRLSAQYSSTHSISLSHTLEFRKKIKKDVRDMREAMETWRATDNLRLAELEAAVRASAGASHSGLSKHVSQLQQQMEADREEIAALRQRMMTSQQEEAAERRRMRDEMDEMRAEMHRLAAAARAAPTPSPIASPASPDATPSRSELQHLHSLFQRLEHSVSAQTAEFTQLRHAHTQHLELMRQSQTKINQRMDEREAEEEEQARRDSRAEEQAYAMAQQLADLQAQLTALQQQSIPSASSSPSHAAPRHESDAAARGGSRRSSADGTPDSSVQASVAAMQPRLATLEASVLEHALQYREQHQLLADVGDELKQHSGQLAALEQSHQEFLSQPRVPELLASTLTKLDDELGDLVGRVDLLEDAQAEAADAKADAAALSAESTRANDALQAEVDRLAATVRSLTERVSGVDTLAEKVAGVETLPTQVSSLRAGLAALEASVSSLVTDVDRIQTSHDSLSSSHSEAVSSRAAELDDLRKCVSDLSAAQRRLGESAGQFRESMQEEVVGVLEQLRAVEERITQVAEEGDAGSQANSTAAMQVVQLQADVRALQQIVGDIAKKQTDRAAAERAPPAAPEFPADVRAQLDSLQQQVEDACRRSEDIEQHVTQELEKQATLVQQHERSLEQLALEVAAKQTGTGATGQQSMRLDEQSFTSDQPYDLDEEEPLDSVSMDLPRSSVHHLAVHIPQSRPGSSHSHISTHSIHPTEEFPPSVSAMASARATPDPMTGSRRDSVDADVEHTPVRMTNERAAASDAGATAGLAPFAPSTPDGSLLGVPSIRVFSPTARSEAIQPEDSPKYESDWAQESPEGDHSMQRSPTRVVDGGTAISLDLSSAFSKVQSSSSRSNTPSPEAATPALLPVPAAAPAQPAARVTFRPSNDSTCRDATDFAALRRELREYGLSRLQSDHVAAGWFSENPDTGVVSISIADKPFNPFARLVAGVLKAPYGDLLAQHDVASVEPAASRFMVARNRPELDAQWASGDAEWLGKASMAQKHEFMLIRDLSQWKLFNVATLGLEEESACDSDKEASLRAALVLLDDLERTARVYTQRSGWSSQLGLFFHAFPFNSVQAMHMHMLDLATTGPTFEHLSHKNLPLEEVRKVLQGEMREINPQAAMADQQRVQPTPEVAAEEEAEDVEEELSEEPQQEEDEQDALDDTENEEEKEEGEEQDDDEKEHDRDHLASPPRRLMDPSVQLSVRDALRVELHDKRLSLHLSCSELPVANTAILVSDCVAGEFIRLGWTEAVEGTKAPVFATPVFATWTNLATPAAEPRDLRFELFQLFPSDTPPRLLASVHILLDEVALELGHEVDFPWSGFDQEMEPPLGETPSLTVKATLAAATAAESAEAKMDTPKLASWQTDKTEQEVDTSRVTEKGADEDRDHAAAASAASAAPTSSAVDASTSTDVADPEEVSLTRSSGPSPAPLHADVGVMLLLRATNLPWSRSNTAVVSLYTQDVAVSPHRVSRQDTQPPSEFMFLAHTVALQEDAEVEEELEGEVLFREPLRFLYTPGHILKLNLYDGDHTEDEDSRMGTLYIRHDDLYDAGVEAAEERAAVAAAAAERGHMEDPTEEVVRELTFFFQHEDPAKHEALQQIELIIESQLIPLDMESHLPESHMIDPQSSVPGAAPPAGLEPYQEASVGVSQSLIDPTADESVRPRGRSGFVRSHNARISLSCRGLPVTKVSLTCDPIVAVFMQAGVRSGEAAPTDTPQPSFEYVQQTEWLRDTTDPDFQDQIAFVHTPFCNQLMKLSVYDVSSESVSDDERIGSVLVKTDDILLSASLSNSLSDSRADIAVASAAARADARQALLDGVGNEMEYELLHDNEAKQAALKGATICIRYEWTDLEEGAEGQAARQQELEGIRETADASTSHSPQQQPQQNKNATVPASSLVDDSAASDAVAAQPPPASGDADVITSDDDSSLSRSPSAPRRASDASLDHTSPNRSLQRQPHEFNLEAARRPHLLPALPQQVISPRSLLKHLPLPPTPSSAPNSPPMPVSSLFSFAAAHTSSSSPRSEGSTPAAAAASATSGTPPSRKAIHAMLSDIAHERFSDDEDNDDEEEEEEEADQELEEGEEEPAEEAAAEDAAAQ